MIATGIVLAGTLVLSYRVFSPRLKRARFHAEVSRLLNSANPNDRKLAAARAAERNDPEINGRLLQGVMGDEPDAGVRAAAVESLGSHHLSAWFGAAEHALELDESGLVRAAGWVAAAQMNSGRCREMLAERAANPDAWDKLGMAAARLVMEDASHVGDLLDAAGAGDAQQGAWACRMLELTLRPMLDSAGRWPLDADPPPGSVWSKELVAKVRRRCAGLDLDALARDTNQSLESGAQAHKLEHRVYNARGRLMPVLFETADKSQ